MSLRFLAKPKIVTQGNTGTASVIELTLANLNGKLDHDSRKAFLARCQACNDGTFANATNATIAAGKSSTAKYTHTANKDLTFHTGVGSKATQTLTISGVVKDSETVTIGSDSGNRVYEFDGNSSVTSGNVAVDISASMTKSQGTLTVDTQPTAGDTFTINTRVYTFVAVGLANDNNEISVGADLAEAKLNIVAAINGTDHNSANNDVTAAAFATDDCVLTAKVPGTVGDTIATTETFTEGTNVFDAATLGTTTAGVDCSANDAKDALKTAIDADPLSDVDARGNLIIDALKNGTAANSYVTTETMANGSWGAATMTGGTDLELGKLYVSVTNTTAETITLRFGPPPVGGRVVDFSESIQLTHAAP